MAAAAAGDVNGDGFGDIVVGVIDSQTNGSAYLFLGAAAGPSDVPLSVSGSAYFGKAVAGAGDLDGDGFADVLVSAPGSGTTPIGSVDVFFGRIDGLATPPVVLGGLAGGYAFE
jgi:hypothetical protein